MSHTSFWGGTETGKTTLARSIARELLKKGHTVIVRDPLINTETVGGGWGSQNDIDNKRLFIFTDDDLFLDFLHRFEGNGAHVFVDEASQIFSVAQTENQWILTRGRHAPWGFSVYLIAQRPTMVAPNARTQCSTCYLFRVATSDAKELMADMAHDYEKQRFEDGDFLIVHSWHPDVSKSNIYKLLGTKPRPRSDILSKVKK